MHVEMRKVTEIKLYPHNPRHNDHAVEAVAASIREFGFLQPLVLDEDSVIVVGATRYKAARLLGLEEVPVHVATGLTPEQLKAYRITDNKTGEIADWNYELLVQEIVQLQQANFDLNLMGFSSQELHDLLDTQLEAGLSDPDDIPQPLDEAETRPGDIWRLGEHRLLCGDAARTEDVDRLLDGSLVHLANTDPPYNVQVEPRSRNAIAAGLSSFTGPTASPEVRCPASSGESQGRRPRSSAPRTGLWPTTSSVTNSSIGSCTPGLAICRAFLSPAAASMSGAAMPTAPIIPRCSRPAGLI